MKQILLLFLFTYNALLSQDSIAHFEIQSQHFKENRLVSITLPKIYEQSAKNYPLILVLDHDLLFDTTTAITNHLSSAVELYKKALETLKQKPNKLRDIFIPCC